MRASYTSRANRQLEAIFGYGSVSDKHVYRAGLIAART
jgi:hypothetical protein